MCEVCENNQEYDWTKIEYGEECYELVVQTSEWDNYHDDFFMKE